MNTIKETILKKIQGYSFELLPVKLSNPWDNGDWRFDALAIGGDGSIVLQDTKYSFTESLSVLPASRLVSVLRDLAMAEGDRLLRTFEEAENKGPIATALWAANGIKSIKDTHEAFRLQKKSVACEFIYKAILLLMDKQPGEDLELNLDIFKYENITLPYVTTLDSLCAIQYDKIDYFDGLLVKKVDDSKGTITLNIYGVSGLMHVLVVSPKELKIISLSGEPVIITAEAIFFLEEWLDAILYRNSD